MQRLQAYRFELQPNGEQQRLMRRFAGSCRFAYNKALALQLNRHEAGEKKLGYAGLCKRLTEWKAQPQTLWLNETPSQALQQALKNLERAYKNFFEKRADFPRFKKKGVSDNRQTQAKFACVECGFEANADLVGAINILARGHRVIACGEPVQSGRSVKQEPTEATQAIAA